MTTIAVDVEQGVMAADRQVTANDHETVIHCDTKIEHIAGYLVAAAGNEGPCEILYDWLRYGDWDDPPTPMDHLDAEDDFSVLMLGDDGLWSIDKFMRPIRLYSRFYGIGTGGGFAWAVLEAGCGIEKAIQTAIKMDPFSGMGYDIVYIND